jgi:hypothetical protein
LKDLVLSERRKLREDGGEGGSQGERGGGSEEVRGSGEEFDHPHPARDGRVDNLLRRHELCKVA